MDSKESRIHFVSGIVAGISNALVCAPLDTSRTRFQIQGLYNEKKYSGIIQALFQIYKKEGFKGLYQGSSISVIAYPTSWSFYFYFYEKSKKNLGKKIESKTLNNLISASFAGVISSIITNPLWLIRVRMQAQYPNVKSSFDILREMVNNEGFFTLYRGITSNILSVVHVAIYFPLYEYLKENVIGNNNPTIWGIIISSWIPKLIASFFSYPYEVLRARLYMHDKVHETRFTGFTGLIRHTYLTEGFKGFYGGFFANLLRILPSTFVTFYTYENIKILAKEYDLI